MDCLKTEFEQSSDLEFSRKLQEIFSTNQISKSGNRYEVKTFKNELNNIDGRNNQVKKIGGHIEAVQISGGLNFFVVRV